MNLAITAMSPEIDHFNLSKSDNCKGKRVTLMVVILGQVIGDPGHWKLSKNFLYANPFFAVQMPGLLVWGLSKQSLP